MALTLENVSVTRGGRSILRDVSATFEPGRVTVILGPNGAGKSTLLQVAAGLLRAEGRVLLDGQDVARMPAQERARAIGYLPQDATVHWDMTVEEVVALGRLPHGDRGVAAIAHAMAETGTADFAHRRIGTLSGGERARVMLARVLAGEPRWLLTDEPLASLDPAHALDVLGQLKRAGSSGIGVVAVVHDFVHAGWVANDVLLMNAGVGIATGPATEVMTKTALEAVFRVQLAGIDVPERRLLVPIAKSSSLP